MRVIHVITGMRKAAGTTTFVENVVDGLRRNGHDAEIAMSDDRFAVCDVIHIHGLWSGLLHRAAGFAKRNGIPTVWSTHGMTAPWSMRHKRWKKLPAWWLYQKWDLKRAAAIHCTTSQEVEWNKALGFENCFVAPLGTDEGNGKIDDGRSVDGGKRERVLLFVGRIYPVKGLLNLIRAWRRVMDESAASGIARDWKLRLVGPDQAGHLSCLKAEVENLGLGDSVEFAGPKYGDELGVEYGNCECLVLPSFTENFGATIVDALASGKPCIASKFTPWEELPEYGCGWWVDNSPESLSGTIREMIGVGDAVRREMGERGRRLVEEKYTWDAVVKAMVKGYERLVAFDK